MAIGLMRRLGRVLAHYLNKEVPDYRPAALHDLETLQSVLQPADILLVEGNLRVSTAIKYLTQSTWSHAALYVGPGVIAGDVDDPPVLIEADTERGVIATPLSRYVGLHTRICRPVGLTAPDRAKVIHYAATHIGVQYDLKNVFDLLRYLLPTPPVPARFRRRLLSLGSGEPTSAICSTLIAQAFQSVDYPILPAITQRPSQPGDPEYCDICETDVYHRRHHSLFTPRDFDISPYFAVVKPSLEVGFHYGEVVWGEPCVPDDLPGTVADAPDDTVVPGDPHPV